MKKTKRNQTKKNLLAILGVVFSVWGVLGVIPFLFQDKYLLAGGAAAFIAIGLVLLAFAFGD